MKQQHLLSYVRRAVQDYEMIQEGDKIAIGISGGKDSLILALALSYLRRFYPQKFEVIGVTVSLGFDDFDLSQVQAFFATIQVPFYICETQIGKIIFDERKEDNPCSLCSKMRKGALYDYAQAFFATIQVPFYICETQIGKIIFDERKEDNPCSLCSKMRKGALYDYAKQLGCNKIALGHNKDDINETLLMSLLYEGRIHTMAPVTYMDQVNMHIIRPLLYVPECDIRGFVKKENLPVVKSPCPVDGKTKREEMKQLIYSLQKEIPKVREHLFGAIQRSTIYGWNKQGGLK